MMHYMSGRVCILLAVCIFVSIQLWSISDMPLMAEFAGEHHCSKFGHTNVSLDFNHDGYDDLIVWSFAWNYDPNAGVVALGKVDVYFGDPDFSFATQPIQSYEGYFIDGSGTGAYRRVGEPYNFGDLNGDGYDDLGIEDMIPFSSKRLLIFNSGPEANILNPDHIIDLPYTDFYWDRLGDVDGDCYDDIGVYYRQSPGNIRRQIIIWGGSFQWQTVDTSLIYPDPGSHINGIGDINNDGFYDISVSYWGWGTDETNDRYIYYGNSQRVFVNPIVLFQSPFFYTSTSRALGDLNGDGYHDFFGCADTEGMKIWFGSDNFSSFQPPNLLLNHIYYGNSLAKGVKFGDVNGDGYDDVVAASYSQRRFAVWLGGNIMNAEADLSKFRSQSWYGHGVAVGDFNADGYDDVAIGAPGEDPQHEVFNPGYVYVYAGNAQMVSNLDETLPPLDNHLQVRVYPNPVVAAGMVNIEIKNHSTSLPLSIEIYNVRGQLVYEAHSDQAKLEINDYSQNEFPAGVYIVKAKAGKHQAIKKFTIIK